MSRDEPGGYPFYWPGGARRRGGVSLVCGSRAEREKACPDTAAQRRREGEPGSGVTRRASEYRRAGTPADRLVVAVKPL